MDTGNGAYTYILDIAHHVRKLVAEAPHPTDHVQGRAFHTDERVKVLAFPFKAGQALTEHTAPHPAVLHFISGEAHVTVGSDALEGRAGTWIHMQPEVPHSIHAQTDCLMLLMVFH